MWGGGSKSGEYGGVARVGNMRGLPRVREYGGGGEVSKGGEYGGGGLARVGNMGGGGG